MIQSQKNTREALPLYESIASVISDLVDKGTYPPGQKVPSIRQMSRRYRVSVNTVRTAYGCLEDRRVIEARPQSGYYVCARKPKIPKEPDFKDTAAVPSTVRDIDLVAGIMGDVMSRNLIQFGAAIPDPDLVPAKRLGRMIGSEARRLPALSCAYSMPPGERRLRGQIARHMVRAGCSLDPDEIVITNGASEAVFLALRCLLEPGDTLAVGSPFYFNFLQMIQALGIRILEIPMSPATGLSLESLESALGRHTVKACLLIPNFNNPLGTSMPDDRKQALLDLLGKADIPLIEDDINGDIAFSPDRPRVIRSWDSSGKTLLCSSFSKTLAPGFRVGWIAPGGLIAQVKRLKLMTNIASPTPTQLAVAEFLSSGGYDRHLRKICRAYAARTSQMADAVGSTFPEGTRVSRPGGGFSLWVELPESIDSLDLYYRAKEQGISLAPGRIFSTASQFNHCIRLNAALFSESNRWAVAALGRIARHLMGYPVGR